MRKTLICAAAFFTGAYLASTAAFGLVPDMSPVPTVTHTVTVDQTYTGAQIAAYVKHTAHNPFAHRCKSEGDDGCYWDASKQGNGKGRSYVVTDSGQVFYFSPSMSEDAHHPFK